MKSGHRKNHLSAILLVFLGFPDLIYNGITLEPELQTQLVNLWTTLGQG
jgi:hypothetical protein